MQEGKLVYIIEIRVTISEETLESWDQSKSDIVLTGDIYSILQKYFYFSQNFVGKFRRDAEHWVEEATIDIVFRVIGITLREGYSLKEVRQLIRDEITHLISGLGSLSFAVSIEEDTSSNILIKITEDPLTAQNLTTIISTLTELYTKCWLIVQGRFPDLINYSQTHDIRFTKEANLTIGMLAHESPTLVELILNPPTLAAAAGAIVTLAGALKIAIDNIGQTSLR